MGSGKGFGTPEDATDRRAVTKRSVDAASGTPTLRVKKLDERAQLPTREHPTDAGLDLFALEGKTMPPKTVHAFRTGLATAFPPGFALLIWDRSGLAVKHGLHRLAGVIDCSYRGELQVVIVNLGDRSVDVKAGDRIAQALLTPVAIPNIALVEDLDDTKRGTSGFGSSGR